MLTKDLHDIPAAPAADRSMLREMLHPDRDRADIRYSLAHATVAPGAASLRHRLTTVEVYYFLQGTGEMHVDEETSEVRPGTVVLIPSGAVQWVRNTGEDELAFLCIVDPAWQEQHEDVLE